MTSRIPDSALHHVVTLVDTDVQATLGRSHHNQIRQIAEDLRSVFHAGGEGDWDLDTYFDRVVADVQKHLGDRSVGTQWPACPKHLDHPLQLIDDHWTCAPEGTVYGRLGELREARASHTPAQGGRPPVDPRNLEVAFRQFADERGVDLDSDPHTRVFSTMLDFYAEVRVEGCDPADDEDMLLLEWGSFDWGSGRAYEVDLFRQLVLPAGAKDYTLAELHVVYRFEEEGGLVRLPAGNDWWGSPARVGEFEEALADNPALGAAQAAQPISVEIYFEGAA